MRLYALLIALASLSGCIDASFDFDLKEEKAKAIMSVSPEAMQSMGGFSREECEGGGGTFTLSAEKARCEIDHDISIDEWIEKGAPSIQNAFNQEADFLPISVEKAGWGKIRISLDVLKIMEETKGDEVKEKPPEEMMQMIKMAMAGHGISFSFKGDKIIESNGEIKADGKTVVFYIPLSDMMDPENKLAPDSYTAVIDY